MYFDYFELSTIVVKITVWQFSQNFSQKTNRKWGELILYEQEKKMNRPTRRLYSEHNHMM